MTTAQSLPPQKAMIGTVDMRVDYGELTAVHDLNLSIAPGEVYGLIGPNGAGKTSTIRVLASLMEPTYGDVFIGGMDVAERPEDVRAILGYMPDLPPVYDDLKVWEFLDVFAGAYRIPSEKRAARVDEVIQAANLGSKREAMSGTLSRGMKQRLILAKTLLPDPKVLLLDEPASGLDPMARIELRELIKQLGTQGKTVLISSHILTELSDFCTSIGIMEKGHLIVTGKIGDIIAQMRPHKCLVVHLLSSVDDAARWVADIPKTEVESQGDGVLTLRFEGDDGEVADLLAGMVSAGIRVKSFAEEFLDVEDIFLQVGAREVS